MRSNCFFEPLIPPLSLPVTVNKPINRIFCSSLTEQEQLIERQEITNGVFSTSKSGVSSPKLQKACFVILQIVGVICPGFEISEIPASNPVQWRWMDVFVVLTALKKHFEIQQRHLCLKKYFGENFSFKLFSKILLVLYFTTFYGFKTSVYVFTYDYFNSLVKHSMVNRDWCILYFRLILGKRH